MFSKIHLSGSTKIILAIAIFIPFASATTSLHNATKEDSQIMETMKEREKVFEEMLNPTGH